MNRGTGHMGVHVRRVWQMLSVMGLMLVLIAPVQATRTMTSVLTNAQGTVVATMNAAGNVTYTAAYRPYGKQQVGTPQPGPGYTGHVNDPDTGLVYMQARYYDPSVGRFLSVDPKHFDPGNIFNYNSFSYANNSPIRYIDPDGRNPGDLFTTPEEAAYDALTYINKTSILENREYFGYIVVDGNKFKATIPMPGSEDRSNAYPPSGSRPVGDYHTHGHYSWRSVDGSVFIKTDAAHDNVNSDDYSRQDKDRYNAIVVGQPYWRMYLATPGGHYYVWYQGRKIDLVEIVKNQRKQEEERRRQERRTREKREKENHQHTNN